MSRISTSFQSAPPLVVEFPSEQLSPEFHSMLPQLDPADIDPGGGESGVCLLPPPAGGEAVCLRDLEALLLSVPEKSELQEALIASLDR